MEQFSRNRETYPKMRPKIPEDDFQQRVRCCEKSFFSEIILRVIYTKNICKKINVKPLNGFQEIGEHRKCNDMSKTGSRYPKTAPLGRLTGTKRILCTWTTRIILTIGPCKVSDQNIFFL